jgi:hypothetical protein
VIVPPIMEPTMLARSWIVSQQVYRNLRCAVGVAILAVYVVLFSMLAGSGVQASQEVFSSTATAAPLDTAPSMFDGGAAAAVSSTLDLPAITSDNSDCPAGERHSPGASCSGHCASCSAAIPFTTFDFRVTRRTCTLAIRDELGLAPAKREIAFRPPRAPH